MKLQKLKRILRKFHSYSNQACKYMKPIYYFLGAGISIVLSIYLFVFATSPNHELAGIFVGLWAPTIIGIGIYNELISIYEEIVYQRKQREGKG